MKLVITAFIIAFAASVAVAPLSIRLLTRLKFGQSIREIGPKWHMKKSGTPPMGGVIFIFGVTLAAVLLLRDARALVVLFSALAFGLVGFLDDYIKVVKKRNLGLTSKQKFTLQCIVAIALLAVTEYYFKEGTAIYLPFAQQMLDFRWLYYPFMMVVLLGGVNSVNLTDGIDGLAASVSAIVLLFFAYLSWQADCMALCALCAAGGGGCGAFLLFNRHPARIFMGDTGSLFLGGLVSAAALVLRQPVVLLLAGFVYFVETLSVILQVFSFKTTGKRIFKMSPLHHHFEMCGWSETKIVTVFCFVTAAMCAVCYLGL